MDLRRPVLAILCAGSPAPGMNAVITAAVLEGQKVGCDVIGIYEGWKRLREGKSKVLNFTPKDIAKIQSAGGSILRTSKTQLTSPQEVDNVLRVLEHLRVRYLVTIGGVMTAHSSSLVAHAAKASKIQLSIVHVPKTIFNDIPLPASAKTFGFATAREVGSNLVKMFQTDAGTMVRWYLLTCVGSQSGHLSLGMAALANLVLIPEEFKKGGVTFNQIVDLVESTIYKRRADDINYGVVILCEGLVDLMDKKEVDTLFNGSVDEGHQDLGRHISTELQNRFKKNNLVITTVPRNIGTECRSADPITDDILLARDLGYGAVRYLIEGGPSGGMITLRGGGVQNIPLADLIDPKTKKFLVRQVDIEGLGFRVAQNYMTKLKKSDLADPMQLRKIADAAGMKPDEFKKRFQDIAADEPPQVSVMWKHGAHIHALPSSSSAVTGFIDAKDSKFHELPECSRSPSPQPFNNSQSSAPNTPPVTHVHAPQAVQPTSGSK